MTELLNTIRAHIDQQYEGNREKARYDDYYRGMNDGLDKLEQFLDTLQEPENPIYELNQFLINWVRDGQTDAEKDARWEAYRRFFELHDEAMMQEPNAADEKAVKEIVKTTRKEVTRQVKEMVKEQPASEGLEEEIKRYRKEEMPVVLLSDLNDIARHFAEWGEKNAYKAIMKKADRVRDKRFDTDYEVKIEPAAGFDWGCVNVYREGKLVGQYVELKGEKELPEGLDEAAEEYAENTWMSGENWADAARRTFKAGAEWRDAQGVNYELEVKADAGGYPYIDKTFELYDYTEDTPIFNPGDKVIVNIRKKEDDK